MTGDRVEAAAREAFWTDDVGGHHKAGSRPHTWENIPEVGRENYRTMVRAVLAAAEECDRVAGRITIDTNDEATIERIRQVILGATFAEYAAREAARLVVAALAAAAGAQPPRRSSDDVDA